jgi:Zn finger protein HypA/HybF involved in hydrogenase expression
VHELSLAQALLDQVVRHMPPPGGISGVSAPGSAGGYGSRPAPQSHGVNEPRASASGASLSNDQVVLRKVVVRAGAAQAIEPQAMQMAWQVMIADTAYAQAQLELRVEPWRLLCTQCGKEWTSADPLECCSCGQPATPTGDADLTLLSMEVDVPGE